MQIVFVVANMLSEQMAEAVFDGGSDPTGRLRLDMGEAEGFALKGAAGWLVGPAAIGALAASGKARIFSDPSRCAWS